VADVTNGIFLHESGDILVDNNTLINGILLLLNSKMVRPNIFTNNIVYATARKGDYTWWQNTHQRILHNELGGTAIFDKNTYISPYAVNGVFVNKTDFTEWQSTSGQDKNSIFNGNSLANDEIEKLFYNDTKSTITVKLSTSVCKDLNGKKASKILTLEPFTSKILITTKSDLSCCNQGQIINVNILKSEDICR
jgi:hypothetical protein